MCTWREPEAADRREDRGREALDSVRVHHVRPERLERALRLPVNAGQPLVPRVPDRLACGVGVAWELGQPRQVNGLDAVDADTGAGQDDDLVPRRQVTGEPGDVRLGTAAPLRRKGVRDERQAHGYRRPNERTKSRSLDANVRSSNRISIPPARENFPPQYDQKSGEKNRAPCSRVIFLPWLQNAYL